MEVEVRQQRRDDSTLRRSGRRFLPDLHFLHDPGFEPHPNQFYNRPVDDSGPNRQQQTVMRYPVEVRLDIRIDHQTAAGFEPFVYFP